MEMLHMVRMNAMVVTALMMIVKGMVAVEEVTQRRMMMIVKRAREKIVDHREDGAEADSSKVS